jgi:hypothetical protein
MADAIEKDQPESKIEEIKKRMEETDKKMEKLKLSDDQKKKLIEKHKAELDAAVGRLMKAAMGKTIKGLDGGFPGMPK